MKGNIARLYWLYDARALRQMDPRSNILYYATPLHNSTNPTLQPIDHQLSNSNYGRVTAMDDIGPYKKRP